MEYRRNAGISGDWADLGIAMLQLSCVTLPFPTFSAPFVP